MKISVTNFVILLSVTMIVLVLSVHGQINTPCSASMLTSFTPCLNFLTNSTAKGSSPTKDCCSAVKSLASDGMDCMCLIVTGNVPFQIPINRNLAISLPRACNMPGVPLQCKTSAAPIPAPGPIALGPISPGISPFATPEGSVVPQPTPSALPPESDTTTPNTGLTPPSPDVNSGSVPTATSGIRPVLTAPSAAIPSYRISPYLIVFALAVLVFN